MTDWQWFWLWLFSVVLGSAACEGAKWLWLRPRKQSADLQNAKTIQEHFEATAKCDWKNVTAADVKPDEFDLRCFYCGFAKYYQDKRGARYTGEDGTTETCRRCNKPVRWESGAEEQARTAVPTESIASAAIPTKTTAPQGLTPQQVDEQIKATLKLMGFGE